MRTAAGGISSLAIAACGFTGVATGPPESGADGGKDASATPRDGGDEGTTVEIEGSIDAPGDAPGDVGADGFVCPTAICNGGCAGGVCLINNPSNNVTCPPGMPCRVRCIGTEVCVDQIDCGSSTTCEVECTGTQACNGLRLECSSATTCALTCGNPSGCNSIDLRPNGGTALCVACVSGSACNSVQCNVSPASLKCTATCDVNNCGNTTSTVTKCP